VCVQVCVSAIHGMRVKLLLCMLFFCHVLDRGSERNGKKKGRERGSREIGEKIDRITHDT